IGEASKVAVITLGVFFPMAINTYAGVRSADPLLIRAAVSFGAGRWSLIRKVLLPSALPMIFAGLKLGAGTSLLLLVAAEMIAADAGIGFLVLHAQNLMETTKLMVGIVLLPVLGVLTHWLLVRCERVAIPWTTCGSSREGSRRWRWRCVPWAAPARPPGRARRRGSAGSSSR